MLLTIVPQEANVFTIQKSCLSEWTVFGEKQPQNTVNGGKFALVPISETAFGVCKLFFQREIHPSYIYLDTSVVHFKSEESNSLPKVPLNITDGSVPDDRIEGLPLVAPVKKLDVSVVVEDIADVRKWKRQEKRFEALVLELLKLYVVTENSVVFLKNLKDRLRHGIHAIVIHSCFQSTKDVLPWQVTSKSDISLRGVTSKLRFEQSLKRQLVPKMGGLEQPSAVLKETIETNIRFKNSLNSLPFKPTKQILLTGPPGCGKTSLIRRIASECGATLLTVLGSETLSSKPGASEEALRKIFDDAAILAEEDEQGLCILLLDEVDSLCTRRDSSNISSHSVRTTVQLLSLLEEADSVPGLIIIATTNKANSIDPSVRRPGRLETEVFINVPSQSQRESIVMILLNNMGLPQSDINVLSKYVASITPGYVGADLALVCQEVSQQYYQRHKINTSGVLTPSAKHPMILGTSDFKQAVTKIKPSALRSGLGVVLTMPTSMDSIGGLQNIKNELRVAIEWPLTHPDAFTRMGLPQPKGVLLYGPPGCAKTSIAKALASATNTTFLSVSAADLFSPYVGEAERSVCELFHRARAAAPTILFIDELDALVGCRGQREAGAQERVLSALLTEMDGIGMRLESPVSDDVKILKEDMEAQSQFQEVSHHEKKVSNVGVIVIAATNRPDMIDSALLRPGRFDKLLYVPAPTMKERLDVLRCVTRNMPLDGTVDLLRLAEETNLYSGADLSNLCKEAALCALTQDGMSVTKLTQDHFDTAVKYMHPSLTEDQIAWYEDFKKPN